MSAIEPTISTLPTFSRIEIRHDNALQITLAATDLIALGRRMRQIANSDDDEGVKRLRVHHEVKAVSQRLRFPK